MSDRSGRARFAGRLVAHAPLAQLAEQQTLNLRVRGSSPWRRTMSDLAFYDSWAACRQQVAVPKHANACRKRAALARIVAAVRNLRARGPARTAQYGTHLGRVTAPRTPVEYQQFS